MSTNQNLQIQQDPFSGLIPNTLASAASVSPTNAVTLISGTVSIATIVPPTRATHQLTFIFTDAAPAIFLTSGNIAVAVTPVQNTALNLQYEPRTQKYYPVSISSAPLGATGYYVPFICAGAGTFDPADSTTYYFGQYSQINPDTSDLTGPPVPVAGTVTAGTFACIVSGTTATTEVVTIRARNATSDTNENMGTTTFSALGPNMVLGSGLSIPVAAGDRLSLGVITPAWATNPTGVFMYGSLFVSTD